MCRCMSVFVCVRACISIHPSVHPSVCIRSELKGVGELASHRSISVLLWQSGDLRCMASCDPDSFLLSPPAPPHWHSGTSSERGKDEREGESKKEDWETGREDALTRS